jgi:transcriptional regulator with XRE-family HTH domain
LVSDIAREIRLARVISGMRQVDLARSARTTQARVSRVERGRAVNIGLPELARLAGGVGLKLVARCYPAGSPLRDAGQIALLEQLRLQVAPVWGWRTEVPINSPGDLRAVDALLSLGGCSIALEAWTRLVDLQAQSRSAQLKRRDIGATRLVILLADTWANRQALNSVAGHVTASFPLGTRAILAALRAGRDPGADGIAVLRIRHAGRSQREHASTNERLLGRGSMPGLPPSAQEPPSPGPSSRMHVAGDYASPALRR